MVASTGRRGLRRACISRDLSGSELESARWIHRTPPEEGIKGGTRPLKVKKSGSFLCRCQAALALQGRGALQSDRSSQVHLYGSVEGVSRHDGHGGRLWRHGHHRWRGP